MYLQLMMDLPKDHPRLYQKLATEGHLVICRTDKYWAGLWPDLVIEQVLMRSLKSRGGLTRGRGMTSSVRMLWVHSMHSCSTVQNAMASLTDHFHNTSEQHVELGKGRIKLDFDELQHILQWFDSSSPFGINRTDLQSLYTGVVADETVNCDNAENVGSTIQTQLDGKPYTKTSRKRKD